MFPEKIRDYFSFTKKERIGVLVLIVLIGVVFVLPQFFSSPSPTKNQLAFEQFKNEISQLKTMESEGDRYKPASETRHPQQYSGNAYKSPDKDIEPLKKELFYFDPNTIDPQQWKALGLREKTIQTIINYRNKGGRFRSAPDLQKVYGLHPEDYQRLLPYVKIASATPVIEREKPAIVPQGNLPARKSFTPAIIDINTADTAALISLPGIGAKLASRIIRFREKLGGFFAVDQVAETYALPDSTFLKIKPFLKASAIAFKKISLNNADANTLKQHPYISWNLANAIIQYRKQHGPFKSTDDLQQIALVTPELFQKIIPYLTN